MPWYAVCDKATFNRQVMAAGNAAYGAFTRMGSWSMAELTDGHIPEEMAVLIASHEELARLLSDKAGLLVAVDGGYQMQEFHEGNPYAAELLERKRELSAKRSAAGKKGAAARWGNGNDSKHDGKPDATCDSTGHGTGGSKQGGNAMPPYPVPQPQNPKPTPPAGARACEAPDELPRTELQDRAKLWDRDPVRCGLEHGGPHTWAEVRDVASAFTEVWGIPAPLRNGGDPRVRTIVERFAEGFTVDQLEAAIRGAKEREWITSNPDLQAIETMLRDAAQVDKHIHLTTAAAKDDHTPRKADGSPDLRPRWNERPIPEDIAAGRNRTA